MEDRKFNLKYEFERRRKFKKCQKPDRILEKEHSTTKMQRFFSDVLLGNH